MSLIIFSARWNSLCLSWMRILERKKAVKLFLSKHDELDITISKIEWRLLEEIVQILTPFYEFTVEMSSERHTTCSKIIPMVKGLYKHLTDSNDDDDDDDDEGELLEESKRFKEELLKNLKKYFMEPDSDKHGMEVENNKICAVATIFDPRFPKDVFSSERTYQRAKKWAKDELIKLEVYTQKSRENDNPIGKKYALKIFKKIQAY